MYGSPLNNKHIDEFCQKIRFDERNLIISEIIEYEIADKTLIEIIELLEESIAKQEPYVNGVIHKAERRMEIHYKKGYKDGVKLTKDEGISYGELSYKKSIKISD